MKNRYKILVILISTILIYKFFLINYISNLKYNKNFYKSNAIIFSFRSQTPEGVPDRKWQDAVDLTNTTFVNSFSYQSASDAMKMEDICLKLQKLSSKKPNIQIICDVWKIILNNQQNPSYTLANKVKIIEIMGINCID